MWDEFYPWFTLQHMFEMEQRRLRPLRIVLKKALWATCDWRLEEKPLSLYKVCESLYNRWLPSAGIPGFDALPTTNTLFEAIEEPKKSEGAPLVCFPHSAMGMGMMSDHCLKEHGHTEKSYEVSCNHARGRAVWEFRNAVIRNYGMDADGDPSLNPTTNKIVVSTKSSREHGRSFTFEPLHRAIAERFPDVPLQMVHFADLSAEEQIRTAASASVLVSSVGGGSVTAMFMPRGSALLLTYPHGKRLDFDMWVNAAWMRVQWFDTNVEPTVNSPVLGQLLDGIERELNTFDEFHKDRR